MQNQITLFEKKSKRNTFDIENRRYIGSKSKLTAWIMYLINNEVKEKVYSFADIFAGTASVTKSAIKYFDRIITNDFLNANNVIYQAFFVDSNWDKKKLDEITNNFNSLDSQKLSENYFSVNFGDKYFHRNTAKKIGYIRDEIQKLEFELTKKELSILLSSLIYTIDRIANTVGHYDAFFNKKIDEPVFKLKLISPIETNKVTVFKEDANKLVRRIKTDVTYVDPPYNSRQYSRFYHLYETLVKWDKPKLYGVALKPEPENVSEYCKVGAKNVFNDLIENINSKYIVVSYNNTYNPKSNSSKNKIPLEQLEKILKNKGRTKTFENSYRFFNAGNTCFNNHKELLFITEVNA